MAVASAAAPMKYIFADKCQLNAERNDASEDAVIFSNLERGSRETISGSGERLAESGFAIGASEGLIRAAACFKRELIFYEALL